MKIAGHMGTCYVVFLVGSRVDWIPHLTLLWDIVCCDLCVWVVGGAVCMKTIGLNAPNAFYSPLRNGVSSVWGQFQKWRNWLPALSELSIGSPRGQSELSVCLDNWPEVGWVAFAVSQRRWMRTEDQINWKAEGILPCWSGGQLDSARLK